ncbi:MAG: radical SAM/SPASM domain-containing protein [Nitrospirae bacterium]|nr:MAG: radical SAM/SPASM domain-containing protein [Nitrospirota bacterium]
MNKKFGHIGIPLKRVHIELTNVCDFNCVFCPKSEMKRSYGYMETALAKRIITEIKENNISEKITFHVMGEPTLHRDFFEILSHARDLGMKVGLTTNGGGLGGKIGKQLLDYDLHQIDISLQTPDKKSFALRKAGKMDFDTYLNGIFDFFSSYISKHTDTIFKFRFLNTRFPKKGLEKRKGPIKVISSTAELQDTFRYWAGRIYDIAGLEPEKREKAMAGIGKLSAYKWNVVEIYPNLFFETYVLEDWGHAFDDGSIKDAWAGYCFGMRDHFSILYNGDVALCCIDFNGRTAIGNLHNSSLKEILSSDELGRIIEGFRRYRVIHPYCKKCLGSKSVASWLLKPAVSIIALKTLKPFFYKQTKLYK